MELKSTLFISNEKILSTTILIGKSQITDQRSQSIAFIISINSLMYEYFYIFQFFYFKLIKINDLI